MEVLFNKTCTAQKLMFSIKHFFSKCDQIRRKLWIWFHLLKKSLMENFISCAVMYGSLFFKIVHLSWPPYIWHNRCSINLIWSIFSASAISFIICSLTFFPNLFIERLKDSQDQKEVRYWNWVVTTNVRNIFQKTKISYTNIRVIRGKKC